MGGSVWLCTLLQPLAATLNWQVRPVLLHMPRPQQWMIAGFPAGLHD